MKHFPSKHGRNVYLSGSYFSACESTQSCVLWAWHILSCCALRFMRCNSCGVVGEILETHPGGPGTVERMWRVSVYLPSFVTRHGWLNKTPSPAPHLPEGLLGKVICWGGVRTWQCGSQHSPEGRGFSLPVWLLWLAWAGNYPHASTTWPPMEMKGIHCKFLRFPQQQLICQLPWACLNLIRLPGFWSYCHGPSSKGERERESGCMTSVRVWPPGWCRMQLAWSLFKGSGYKTGNGWEL